MMSSMPFARVVAALVMILLAAACARPERPPSSLYEGEYADRYERLPVQLKSTEVNLLYVTDRKPEQDEEGRLRYGVGRSQSLAFGAVVVELDEEPILAAARRLDTRSTAHRPRVRIPMWCR